MTHRYTAILCNLCLVFVAACDSASNLPKVSPAPPTAAPAPPPPATAPLPPAVPAQPQAGAEEPMIKPAGLDPAKLAQHAKALAELGYRDEATKLYTHACAWGHAKSCALLENPIEPLAAPSTPTASVAHRESRPEIRARESMQPPASAQATAMTMPAAMAHPKPAHTSLPMTAAAPVPPPPVVQHAAPPAQAVAQPPAVATAVTAPAGLTPSLTQPPAPAAPQVAAKPSASPAPTPPADKAATAAAPQRLSQEAQKLARIGYLPLAIRLYKDACLAGDGESCKLLGEIYIKGSEGVERDYAESVRWYSHARQLGVAVPTLEKRTVIR